MYGYTLSISFIAKCINTPKVPSRGHLAIVASPAATESVPSPWVGVGAPFKERLGVSGARQGQPAGGAEGRTHHRAMPEDEPSRAWSEQKLAMKV